MEIQLFKFLNLDLSTSKRNKNFQLSDEFIEYHRIFMRNLDSERFFTLQSDITVQRKDQLLLNIQYNNLLYSVNVYMYEDYCRYAEEFFTYMLNYQIVTRRGCPTFPDIIQNIFLLLNKFHHKM